MTTLTEPEFLTLTQHIAEDVTTPPTTLEARRFIVALAFASKSETYGASARSLMAEYSRG